jgi:hypothetical protein
MTKLEPSLEWSDFRRPFPSRGSRHCVVAMRGACRSDRVGMSPPVQVFGRRQRRSIEGAVTTDICGKKDSHALRLDKEAVETIRKARLHQKVATTIFFEDYAAADKATRSFVDAATKEHGSSARTFKSGLVWAVPDGADSLRDDARKVLAWEDIADEETNLRLDDGQKRQLAESLKKAPHLRSASSSSNV